MTYIITMKVALVLQKVTKKPCNFHERRCDYSLKDLEQDPDRRRKEAV